MMEIIRNKKELKIRALYDPDFDSYKLYFFMRDSYGNRYNAKGVEFEKVDAGQRTLPFIEINSDTLGGDLSENPLQPLMNDLWDLGMRPIGRTSNPEEAIRAKDFHLADMRKIAFGLLKGLGDEND